MGQLAAGELLLLSTFRSARGVEPDNVPARRKITLL
jgi:hypothetical protein